MCKKFICIILIIMLLILNCNFVFAAEETIDNIIEGANSFLDAGQNITKFNPETMQQAVDVLYNIFLGVGMVIAVIVGIILGIQFMTSGSEEKAKIKESLIGYVIGCIVVFGAFGIWKIAIMIIS